MVLLLLLPLTSKSNIRSEFVVQALSYAIDIDVMVIEYLVHNDYDKQVKMVKATMAFIDPFGDLLATIAMKRDQNLHQNAYGIIKQVYKLSFSDTTQHRLILTNVSDVRVVVEYEKILFSDNTTLSLDYTTTPLLVDTFLSFNRRVKLITRGKLDPIDPLTNAGNLTFPETLLKNLRDTHGNEIADNFILTWRYLSRKEQEDYLSEIGY